VGHFLGEREKTNGHGGSKGTDLIANSHTVIKGPNAAAMLANQY
jgi:hypothetical protein